MVVSALLVEGAHVVLYIILFAMPVNGWIGTNACGEAMNVFGSVTLPAVIEKNEALSDVLWTMHNVLGLTLGGLIVVHAGATLAHHFVLTAC